jgi:DNA adenine methylase
VGKHHAAARDILAGGGRERCRSRSVLGGQRWDRPKTLFYLDPPYWGTEHYYGRGLCERADFERLSAALQRLQGRFILSLNDVPEVRELFVRAPIETVELRCQAGGAGHTKRVRDLMIANPGKAHQ